MAEQDMGDDIVELPDETPLDGPMPDEAAVPTDDKAEAKNRAMRTVLQGGLFTVILAVGQAVATINGADVNWKLLGLTALQAASTALVAYVQKLLGK